MPRWPENPDDDIDPAIAPLIEAGEGESTQTNGVSCLRVRD